MKNTSNYTRKAFSLATVVALAATASTHAALTIASTEPSTNVLLDAISGGSVATLINASAAQGARGTTFTLGTTGDNFGISGITIQANNADTFGAGETFTIAIYSGTAGTFTAAGSFANVTPAYLDTASGLTLLGSETFTATTATGSSAGAGEVASSEYVNFGFTSNINVNGGETLTMMVFTNFAFSHLEGNNNGGGRLQFRETTTDLVGAGTRDMRFSVTGVPEPSVALLGGLGLLGLLRRRRN